MKLFYFIFSDFYRFLKKMPYLCGMTGEKAKKASKKITHMFVDELTNKESIYGAKTYKISELIARIELITNEINSNEPLKIKNCKDRLILKGLYKYKKKRRVFNEDYITKYETALQKNSQPTIEQAYSMSEVARGFWWT